MRLILDTHILLWWWDDSARLTQECRDLIADPSHEVFVSAVSIAEIAVKRSIGRLVVGRTSPTASRVTVSPNCRSPRPMQGDWRPFRCFTEIRSTAC